MASTPRTVLTLCGLAAILGLASCATTQESIQDCRKAAFAFCDKTVKKGAGSSAQGQPGGPPPSEAYRQCLDVQLAACGFIP